MIRRAKGSWINVQNGDLIRLNSDGSGGTSLMIATNIVHAPTIEALVNKHNYMMIYPRSTGVEHTCRYVGRTLYSPIVSPTHEGGGYVSVSLKLSSALEASESELDQFSGSTKGMFQRQNTLM